MSGPDDIAILIPAAGAAARMLGRDKLVELVAGEPILRRTARLAVGTGARVFVTLPVSGAFQARRLDALSGVALTLVPVADPGEGMAASLRAGAAAAAGFAGLMILLPDMPEIDADDISNLMAAFAETPDRPLRATASDGTAGHPVILPAALLPALGALRGDQGARSLLRAHPPRLVALAGRRAVTDLDTPEDWALWRAR